MVAIAHPTARPTGSITGSITALRPAGIRRPTPAVYRRRRLAVAGALLLAVALAAAVLGSLRTGSGSLPAESVATVSVVVEPGDTVWSLAESIAPGQDLRPVVDAIVDANGGAALIAGQRLTLSVP